MHLVQIREVTSADQSWQQHQYKAIDALRAATKKKEKTFTNIWDGWKNDSQYRKSQTATGWNDEFVRYLDHIVQIDISHDAPAETKGRYCNLVNLRGIEENMQGMPLEKRPGFREAKIAITEVQRQSRKEIEYHTHPSGSMEAIE